MHIQSRVRQPGASRVCKPTRGPTGRAPTRSIVGFSRDDIEVSVVIGLVEALYQVVGERNGHRLAHHQRPELCPSDILWHIILFRLDIKRP